MVLTSCGGTIPTPDLDKNTQLAPTNIQIPTDPPAPTNTPAPSETPSPTQTFTPEPMPTCPVATERSVTEHDQEHARIEEVYYRINEGEAKPIERNGIIELKQGEIFKLTQLTYYANTTLDKDALALEAYYHYDDCSYFHDEDGLFSKGVVLYASPDENGKLLALDNHWEKDHSLKNGWEVHQGWDKILIVLVHYFPGCPPDGCFATEDRFRIQLVVMPSSN